MKRREFLLSLLISPLAHAAAAQGRLPRLAILSPSSRGGPEAANVYLPFGTALAELGWRAGHNIEIIERFADRAADQLPALAGELVALRPDVIFTNTGPAAYAAAEVTQTIPVVVGPAAENVLLQLAGNLARPKGNVTGLTLTSQEQDEKCIELLKEAAPAVGRVGVLVNPLNASWAQYPALLEPAVRSLGLTLFRLEARGASEIDAAFTAIQRLNADALFVPDDANIVGDAASGRRIIELATQRRLPAASTHQPFAREGGLLSLGTDIPALARRAAVYVDKILKGAKASDLPIERPTTFKVGVNLKTAKALGVELPVSILLRADEVIE